MMNNAQITTWFAITALAVMLAAQGEATGQICTPHWDNAIGQPGLQGFGGAERTNALTVFDDGSGLALYAGGSFASSGAATLNRIGKWANSQWNPLSDGLGASLNSVYSLAVFDGGSGNQLYAGGNFTSPFNRIARWDGSDWSAVGFGLNGDVKSLAVFDDNTGSQLYAGGGFTSFGGSGGPVNHIAKWNGKQWSIVGTGISGNAVNALIVFHDGASPALFAGGLFTGLHHIAKWNGTTWSTLGTGMNGEVNALEVYDDGNGPALYAGGNFTTADGVPASRIAKWNGSSWSPVGLGIGGSGAPVVRALKVYDDGSGPALYVSGAFTLAGGQPANRIARWNGSAWLPMGTGLDVTVHCRF